MAIKGVPCCSARPRGRGPQVAPRLCDREGIVPAVSALVLEALEGEQEAATRPQHPTEQRFSK